MNISEELEKLKGLLDQGVLSTEEFSRAKAKLLGVPPAIAAGADPLGSARSGAARGESLLDLYPGQEVGAEHHRFRLVSPLGSGGMGVVWRAVDLRDSAAGGRELQVALKMLPVGVRASAVDYQRLQKEALRARTLSHPNIVNVYDWHEDSGGWVFLAMEYLQGRNLDQVLADEGPEGLPLPRLLELITSVAEAIDWAYREHRLIHRDIKPGNIFLTRTNTLKVLDFGLSPAARASSSASATGADRSGTLAYMPPEAFRQTRVHPSRDVYALSVTFYHLLTGYTPWPSEVAALRNPGAPWPDAPEALRAEQWAALKARLAYDSKARPQTCHALLAQVRRVEPAKPISSPQCGAAEVKRRQAEEARRQEHQRQGQAEQERQRLKAVFDEQLKAGRLSGPGETALSLHSAHPQAPEATQAYRAVLEGHLETASRVDEAKRIHQ